MRSATFLQKCCVLPRLYLMRTNSMEIILSDKEYSNLLSKISNNTNFAYISLTKQEKNILVSDANSFKKFYLQKAIDTLSDNFILGVPCCCCQRELYYWFSSRINSDNRTISDLFNKKNTEETFKTLNKSNKDIILISEGDTALYETLKIKKHFKINTKCKTSENDFNQLIETIKRDCAKSNQIFLISAGDCTIPIITALYQQNTENCYIDFHNINNKVKNTPCYIHNPKTTPFDVSVVLTLYKRPQNLEYQIKALEKQTLKPKQILLYQDGTGDEIKIPENLIKSFDVIEICHENKGVWARFKFASQVIKTTFACIYDDDTVSGSRWLENCHYNMTIREGLYGTIGILCQKPENYPVSDFIRLGWSDEINTTKEVDFVGHSWFLKTERIYCMFENTEKFQEYKRAGEDMCLSACLRKYFGIKTFVPPHPVKNKELWGSLPQYANKLGNNNVAISKDKDNKLVRKEFINKLIADGYTFLADTNKEYTLKMDKAMKKAKTISRFIPVKALRHSIRSKLKEKYLSAVMEDI